MMDGMWNGGWGMMGMGLMMLLITLVFLALIVGGVYLLVRALRGEPHRSGYDGPDQTPPRSNALSILEERYARGEIDREEFEERRRALGA